MESTHQSLPILATLTKVQILIFSLQRDLLGERSTNSYPPAVSTPSPPSTQLQRSISSAEIQQKIPELIAISDGDKSSHTNQSHPSATIITVSMADLNRLIRFRPVLRLKQVAKGT